MWDCYNLGNEGRDEFGSPGVGVAEYFQFITSLWKLAFFCLPKHTQEYVTRIFLFEKFWRFMLLFVIVFLYEISWKFIIISICCYYRLLNTHHTKMVSRFMMTSSYLFFRIDCR